jgi:hypothetical protein
MGDGAELRAFLYVQGIGVAIASLIGAVFLPATCALYNKIAGGRGSPASVPEPSMAKAMGILFAVALINAVLGFFIALVIAAVGSAAGARQQHTTLLAELITFPISLLVMSRLLSVMLPTAFGRALVVTLLYLLIVVLVLGMAAMMVLILGYLGAGYFRV